MRVIADRYHVAEELGRGGMGVVFRARDERLGRDVALKTLRAASDPTFRERLWREARAAASLSHPNVCQVYDVAEAEGELFVAMELLDGESLEQRLLRGALPLAEAVAVAEGILAALAALHERGIVHRDLKPSNVFLGPHGVKVLDFGLALPLAGRDLALTSPGTLLGTPRYMAPEQWGAGAVGPAADLFACGALLFEMLAGRPAFDGDSPAAVCGAVLGSQPPALAGGARVEAVDRVLRRALAKRPDDRWASAAAMAQALREASRDGSSGETAPVRPVTRLMVLPFRLLRPDPEIEFLSFGLADAVTVALGGVRSLVVRSSLDASRLAAGALDLTRLAADADVDAVLFGTLLRGGDSVRLQAQLVQTPGGTVLATATAQAGLADVFALQDELTRAVVAALSLSLAAPEAPHGDLPAAGHAYELYLRANDLRAGTSSTSLLVKARDLYRGAVAADPNLAPAWARLGRTYRVMAKYGHGDAAECLRLAGEAFRRALEISPDLPLTHNLYTYFELEEPGGALPAMRRLLGQVARGARDPQLYAGLVAACRFCGLLDASVAAHLEARRLDPTVRSSVHYTYWLQGDYARAMAADDDDPPGIRLISLADLGRVEEAIEALREVEERHLQGLEATWVSGILAAFEGDAAGAIRGASHALAPGFRDPEGIYINARPLPAIGEPELALQMLSRAAQGYWVAAVWERDPAWEALRGDPRFAALLHQVRTAHLEAGRAFADAGGEALLGLAPSDATRVLAEPPPLPAAGEAP